MTTTMQPPRSATRPRIAIVGGGPGGLLTAWHLERQATRPAHVTLFEASGRLGGKVLTPSFATAPVRYEAGAAELYDYTPVGEDPLRELVASLGLPTVPLGGATVVTPDGPVANLDDLGAVLGPAARRDLEAFDREARGAMTRREFYAADQAAADAADTFATMLAGCGEPAARRYVETMIHSDLATEPGLTNVGYGLQNYLMNDPAYMRLYAIAGGNERLIEAVVAGLHAAIRLHTPVLRIDATPGGRFRVITAGSPSGKELFDAVVLALPLQHLARIDSDDDTLAAAVTTHCERFDHPAHYLRVTALFDEPFWRGRIDGGYLMLDAFDGCCLYDESAREPEPRHGVLGWLLAGTAAAAWAGRDDDAIAAAALESLPHWLGDARRHLREARVHRWIGAVSGLPGGWRPPAIDRRHQPAPTTHPHLFVVGDYLFDSTLNGVLDSAQHVAGWLATEFG
ncbi:MAG: flavin monoamine oxidase family protein [Pirellulales bacterium]